MSHRFLLAASLAMLQAAASAESPSEFAFALPITQMDGEAFFRLNVPQQVYESTAYADLRDVRHRRQHRRVPLDALATDDEPGVGNRHMKGLAARERLEIAALLLWRPGAIDR